MKVLDVVLHKWLNNVTTLLGPPITLLSMCQPQSNTDVPTKNGRKSVVAVRVEASGSGAVIVPRFDINVTQTTCGELFDCVRHWYSKLDHNNGSSRRRGNGGHLFFRLICDDKEVINTRKKAQQLVTEVFDIVRDKTLYLVALDKELHQRQCLMKLYNCTNGREWRMHYSGSRQKSWALRWSLDDDWEGVSTDPSSMSVKCLEIVDQKKMRGTIDVWEYKCIDRNDLVN